jgi:hypothetical protein
MDSWMCSHINTHTHARARAHTHTHTHTHTTTHTHARTQAHTHTSYQHLRVPEAHEAGQEPHNTLHHAEGKQAVSKSKQSTGRHRASSTFTPRQPNPPPTGLPSAPEHSRTCIKRAMSQSNSGHTGRATSANQATSATTPKMTIAAISSLRSSSSGGHGSALQPSAFML